MGGAAMCARGTTGRPSRRSPVLIHSIEPRRLMSAFTVNTLSDVTNAGDGLTTLREAIVAANAHSGVDSISFSAAVFPVGSLHTIKLTGGQLNVTDTAGATTITGPGASVAAVNGDGKSRVFHIAAGATVSMSGLAIVGGKVNSAGGGSGESPGGGIFNAGPLSPPSAPLNGHNGIRGRGPAA